MANSPQAKKRVRQAAKRTLRNKSRISRIRTMVRAVEEAIGAGDKDAAQAAFKSAMPELHRGVSKGVLHRNTAARKLSRMNARIRAL
ncbi:MAG: 30S ribosomal protein S20 [Alphaproteobacteria bacterium]|nr:30S ribosomal protein S20 [Alphaproteobacteria bacterium]